MKKRPKRLPSTRLHLLGALRAIERAQSATLPPEKGLLAKHNLETAIAHLEALKKRKTRIEGALMSQSDLPSELGSYSDGVADDAAYHPEIIGAHCTCSPSVSGLGDLAVAGIPSYLLSKKSLSNPALRRRVARAIERMTPKMKRRVLGRLKTAVSVARVSGAVRSAYPTIAGSSGRGWNGITVSGRGGCSYENVAGPLTP